jgi:hypothetical protein
VLQAEHALRFPGALRFDERAAGSKAPHRFTGDEPGEEGPPDQGPNNLTPEADRQFLP